MDPLSNDLPYEPNSNGRHFLRPYIPWIIACLSVLVAIWLITTFVIPICSRYQFYRLQQRVANYTNLPNVIAFHFSATQPYARVAGPVDQFYDNFWTERAEVRLPTFISNPIPGSPATPIFCGTLTTSGGQRRIVQVHVSPGKIKWSPMSFVLDAKSSQLQTPEWILTGDRHQRYDDSSMAGVQIALNPPYDVTVFTGTLSTSNPSEVDFTAIVNSRTKIFRLYLVDWKASPRPGGTDFAVDFDTHWATTEERGWMSGGMDPNAGAK